MKDFIIKIPLILNRLNIIKAFIIDIILLGIFSILYENISLLKPSFGFKICFLLVWIFFSYTYERFYDLFRFIKNENYKSLYYFSIKSIAFNSIFIFIISNTPFKNTLIINKFLILSFCFIVSSFIIQSLSYKYFAFKKHDKWIYFGDKQKIDNLKNDYYFINNNLKIKILKDENFEYIIDNVNKFDSLIVENDILIDNHYLKKLEYLRNKRIKIISLNSWLNSYMESIPNDFFDKDEAYNRLSRRSLKLQFIIKRLGDLFVSSILLFVTFPIIIFSIFIIYIQDRGPIFYSQERTGQYGKKFQITKLRSMRVDAEKEFAQWSLAQDKRITKFGKLLRLTRIDELPQLISVLKGEMTLIGPRPERPEIDSKLQRLIPNYSQRYLLKPGLSGWAQVNYPYGASVEDANVKLNFDLYYVKNISLFIDLLIFIKTIRLVFNARGAIAL